MKVIGFHGKAGVGKSTAAKYLEQYYGADTFSFAQPLKDAAAAMLAAFGYQRPDMDREGFKQHPIRGLDGITGRQFLQRLGTEFGRELVQEDFWHKNLDSRIQNLGSTLVIVDDVRFDSEAQFLRDTYGATIIEIVGRKTSITDPTAQRHASESGLTPNLIDLRIHNTAELNSLYSQLDELMDKIQ